MTLRHAGLSLMAGVILAFVAPLFMPGYAFIDSVDQTDFGLAVGALAGAPVLAQWMTFFTIIAMLLMSFGLLGLLPLAGRQPGWGGRILQFGIIATIVEWSIVVITSGMRHFEIHLLQRSTLAPEGTVSPAEFEAAALATHFEIVAITMAFLALAPIASSMVGLGLLKRFDSMSLSKLSCYILLIGGIVGLGNFLFALNSADLGIHFLLFISTAILYIQGLCLIVIGYGMYSGRKELAEES